MGKKRNNGISPRKLSRNIAELVDLTEALCIIAEAEGDKRQGEAMRALAGVIAQRVDALFITVQEARE